MAAGGGQHMGDPVGQQRAPAQDILLAAPLARHQVDPRQGLVAGGLAHPAQPAHQLHLMVPGFQRQRVFHDLRPVRHQRLEAAQLIT